MTKQDDDQLEEETPSEEEGSAEAVPRKKKAKRKTTKKSKSKSGSAKSEGRAAKKADEPAEETSPPKKSKAAPVVETGHDESDDSDEELETEAEGDDSSSHSGLVTADAAGAEHGHSAPGNAAMHAAMGIAAAAIIGLGVGWALGGAQAGSSEEEVGPVASGSAGGPAPICEQWREKICAEAGEKSFGCTQAKGASELMPPRACKVALKDVSVTMAQVNEMRASCIELVTKLCKDLGEDSSTCEMVRDRTPQFPTERCTQMLGDYANVLKQLERMGHRGSPPQRPSMSRPDHGKRPGAPTKPGGAAQPSAPGKPAGHP